jgi:hypothetical protein
MKSKFGYFMFGAFVVFVFFFFLFFSGVIKAKAQPLKQQYLADKKLTKYHENKSGDWTPYVDNGKVDWKLSVKEDYAKDNQKVAARKSQMKETHAKPVASLKDEAKESEYKYGDRDLAAYSITDKNEYGITGKEGDAYYDGDKTDIGYHKNSDDNKDYYVAEYNSKPDSSAPIYYAY